MEAENMDIGKDRDLKCPCCNNPKLLAVSGVLWSSVEWDDVNMKQAKKTKELGIFKVKNNKFYHKNFYSSTFRQEDIPTKIFCKCGYTSADIKDF